MTVHEKLLSCQEILKGFKDLVILESERIGLIAVGMEEDEVAYCESIKTAEDLQKVIDKEIEYLKDMEDEREYMEELSEKRNEDSKRWSK